MTGIGQKQAEADKRLAGPQEKGQGDRLHIHVRGDAPEKPQRMSGSIHGNQTRQGRRELVWCGHQIKRVTEVKALGEAEGMDQLGTMSEMGSITALAPSDKNLLPLTLVYLQTKRRTMHALCITHSYILAA